MLQHGCADWGNRWKEYPLPNKFLGVTEETAEEYDKLSTMEKCVWRYLSHRDELYDKLKVSMVGRLHVIDYDAMALTHRIEIEKLRGFMEGVDIPLGSPDKRSVFKSFDYFGSKECVEIAETTGKYYDMEE
jgi:hypothetical protein